MSENNQIGEKDLMLTPGKIMFFTWINNLFLKNQASFSEDNSNIVELSSYPSTWFCIGRNTEEKSPFIGIQEHMVPWFFETPWRKACIVEEEGKLYLTCGDKEISDFTLSIKVRQKRLAVLWGDETQRHLDFRIIKIGKSDEDIAISEKVYKRIPLENLNSSQDVVKEGDFSIASKTEEYEKEIKSKFEEKFVSMKKRREENE